MTYTTDHVLTTLFRANSRSFVVQLYPPWFLLCPSDKSDICRLRLTEHDHCRVRYGATCCSHADVVFLCANVYAKGIDTYGAFTALHCSPRSRKLNPQREKIAKWGREGSEFSQWQAQQQKQQRKHPIKCGVSRMWLFCTSKKKKKTTALRWKITVKFANKSHVSYVMEWSGKGRHLWLKSLIP